MKPDDVSQEAWDAACKCVPDYVKATIKEAIARAITAAVAAEREACLTIAVDIINAARGSGDSDLRSVRARVETAIRARSTP